MKSFMQSIWVFPWAKMLAPGNELYFSGLGLSVGKNVGSSSRQRTLLHFMSKPECRKVMFSQI